MDHSNHAARLNLCSLFRLLCAVMLVTRSSDLELLISSVLAVQFKHSSLRVAGIYGFHIIVFFRQWFPHGLIVSAADLYACYGRYAQSGVPWEKYFFGQCVFSDCICIHFLLNSNICTCAYSLRRHLRWFTGTWPFISFGGVDRCGAFPAMLLPFAGREGSKILRPRYSR